MFCDVISMLAQVFNVSFDRAYNGVMTYQFCDMTVP